MKKLAIIIAVLFSLSSYAQVTKVTIQASGLTCSMCSNAINKALKSVEYVDKVYANIKNSSFDISFKPGAAVNFDQLKKKVVDAGFSVAKFNVTMQFNDVTIEPDTHVNVGGMMMHFINVKNKTLSGEQTIQVLDKGYVSAKAFKKNAAYTKMECYKTGVAGSCCTKKGMAEGTRVYHVTIS